MHYLGPVMHYYLSILSWVVTLDIELLLFDSYSRSCIIMAYMADNSCPTKRKVTKWLVLKINWRWKIDFKSHESHVLEVEVGIPKVKVDNSCPTKSESYLKFLFSKLKLPKYNWTFSWCGERGLYQSRVLKGSVKWLLLLCFLRQLLHCNIRQKMNPLHDSIFKLWIMYEGTEKMKKHDVRHFVIETTKNLMNRSDI